MRIGSSALCKCTWNTGVTQGRVTTSSGELDCSNAAPATIIAFNDVPTDCGVKIGLIASGDALQGPSPVASCLFTGAPTLDDIRLMVEDASDDCVRSINKESVAISLRIEER